MERLAQGRRIGKKPPTIPPFILAGMLNLSEPPARSR